MTQGRKFKIGKSILEVNHNGIISAWGSRKAFWDCNKDKSNAAHLADEDLINARIIALITGNSSSIKRLSIDS